MQLKEILYEIEHISFVGNDQVDIKEVLQLTDVNFHSNAIAWCGDNYFQNLTKLNEGTVIVSSKGLAFIKENKLNTLNVIEVVQPRSTFATLLDRFFVSPIEFGCVSSSASIHSTVVVDQNAVWIGENVVIEEGCVLGRNVKINHNSVLYKGTIVGDDVVIGANCSIGGVGFGFEKNTNGAYVQIPHIGNVKIDDRVEIGNNTAIDRAVLGSTWIKENAKIDNLVHIAHGVEIGENAMIIANAMIAGSVVVEDNAWVAPSVSVIQKKRIGANSTIGMGSVVLKDVEQDSVVAGVPAKRLDK